MTGLGTILNIACILLGGLAGLFIFRSISVKTQQTLKATIALVSLVIGFMMIWEGLSGSFPLQLNWAEAASGGSGYQVEDILEPHGGRAARTARVKVKTVSKVGAITKLEVVEPGDYSSEPPASTSLKYTRRANGQGNGATTKAAFGEFSRNWLLRFYLFIVVMLSLSAGKWVGGKIGIQRRLNLMGAWARKKFTSAAMKEDEKHPPSEGFVTCTLLFCVGPMALLGSIQDGLTGDIQILAIKSVMDGISTMTFATTFGWSVLFAAVPVLIYQGTLTLLATVVKQWLDALPEAALLLDSMTATGGFIVLCIPFLLLEIRRIQLADYLPALVIAPAAAWTFLP